ncbi:MAG: creatininase family protein [Alphaproteobacteria bacterium]|nr:MAG: creatininase family protein [Alphaproteobacteria bacterium]
MPSVMWKELTAEDLRAKAAANATVILPVASMEQHGPHLPVGVDTYLCEAVCKAGAEIAIKDVPVVVAPTLWCGMAEHHMAYGGTFTFDIPTYRAVLLAFLRSIERHGFKRVFIINGHGGNIAALNAFLPDFARETALKVLATTYFELSQSDLGQFLEDQKRVHHACEVETSMMMVVAPDTVKRDRFAEAYGMLGMEVDKVLRGPPAQFHNFKAITPSGVIGDARRASADKGGKLLAVCAEGLAAVLKNEKVWG